VEIIKEIFSKNNQYKAEIVKRKDNSYQVFIYFWDDKWETWLEKTEGLSITDNEQSAIDSAAEHLRNHTGEDIEK
jgi:hypothetical protein